MPPESPKVKRTGNLLPPSLTKVPPDHDGHFKRPDGRSLPIPAGTFPEYTDISSDQVAQLFLRDVMIAV